MLKPQQKNSLIINNALEIGGDIASEANGKGRKFVSRFIEPGLAHYEEFGDVLITKETIDKFVQSMVGCPVIIKHKDITDANADKERVGVISRVWYDEKDGWFYCEGVIWNKQAIDLVKNQGWNVSCTYDFESDFKKGMYHGKEYDMEFTNGEFLHLALVPNPRYERANIVMNSQDAIDSEKLFLVGLETIIENALDSELSDKDKAVLNGLNEVFNSFPEHDGRPGQVGGSLPREGNNVEKDSLSLLLGKEIKGVKGQEAIEALREKQSGHVKGAFTRSDIGSVDLIWGDEDRGLCHIIKRREEQNINVDEFLSNLTEVIEKGQFVRMNEKGRYEIFYNKKMAIIEPAITNGQLTFLLTSFKRKKP